MSPTLLLLFFLLPLISSNCCTPQCCCPSCTSCTDPVTERCNNYRCTSYAAACPGATSNWNRVQYQTINQDNQYHQPIQYQQISSNVNGQIVNAPCGAEGDCQKVNPSCPCKKQEIAQETIAYASHTRYVVPHSNKWCDPEESFCLFGFPGWIVILAAVIIIIIIVVLIIFAVTCFASAILI